MQVINKVGSIPATGAKYSYSLIGKTFGYEPDDIGSSPIRSSIMA